MLTIMRYLFPAILKTARPPLIMLAVLISALSSCGLLHLAFNIMLYHSVSGRIASEYAALPSQNFTSVLFAMTRIYQSPNMGEIIGREPSDVTLHRPAQPI